MSEIPPQIEYRAVAQRGLATPQCSHWSFARSEAKAAMKAFGDEASPPFSGMWFERREVSNPVLVPVEKF